MTEPMGPRREERRSSGVLRVPFVRRCSVDFGEAPALSAFVVNINILGAYVASNTEAKPGQPVTCRFRVPGNELDVSASGIVAWLNPIQRHPVHSLPPGFGIRFVDLSEPAKKVIEGIVRDYVTLHTRRRS
jgi:hypothetical protein